MSLELELLHVIGNFDNYKVYAGQVEKLVKTGFLSPASELLFSILTEYYEKYGDTRPVEWVSLPAWAKLMSKKHNKMTSKDADTLRLVCDNLSTYSPPGGGESEVVMRLQAMDLAERVAPLVEDLAVTGNPDVLCDIKALIDTAEADISSVGNEHFVTDSIEDIIAAHVTAGGYEWRFDEMNVMAGPIRGGDMVIVFGRPEIGKTSFVISEVMHWATQFTGADEKVVIFNNEEGGSKLKLRAYTVALDKDAHDLSKIKDVELRFKAAVGGDRLLVYDNGTFSTRDVERVCDSIEPRVIVFNVIDKVDGFNKLSEVDRLRRVAQWARDLAKKYNAVVVCVGQADASAEGEKYLTKDQFYGSKTGIPGEADLMIGIGHDPNDGDHRYLHVSKNKLTGGARTDPKRKHGYAMALFDGSTGRYTNDVSRPF